MATPSLFPQFMKAQAGGAGTGTRLVDFAEVVFQVEDIEVDIETQNTVEVEVSSDVEVEMPAEVEIE